MATLACLSPLIRQVAPASSVPILMQTGVQARSARLQKPWKSELIHRLAGEIRGCAVLDVGCGDGALTRAFRHGGAAFVAGCDTDPRMIARACAQRAQMGADIIYAVARAEQLPFRDGSFDLVTVITVLAFVPEPELALARSRVS